MCGRFTLHTPPEVLRRELVLGAVPVLLPRFNIAPTQPVAAVRTSAASGTRELVLLRWGLVPSWADDPAIGNRLINARVETVADKPSFRSALRARRCLVLADGFYEWRKQGSRKQPYYFQLHDGRPFAFAGLWEHWSRAETHLETCTILTTQANELVHPVHERMPVILPRTSHDAWLDPASQQPERLLSLLAPYPAREMTAWPVSAHVSSPRHDDPTCIEPAAAPQPELFADR